MRGIPILVLLILLVPGCGNGNIGDLFAIFPPDSFSPDEPGDGGPIQPPPGGGFETKEVGFIESAQGVDGDVRNIALAQVGSQTYAFLSAGTAGIHVVDVTEPERVNSNYIATLDATTLAAPAALSGDRSDDVAVVDNTYLVSIAVGTAATNAVTVFHIPTIIDRATLGGNLGDSFVPHVGGPDIGVPGVAGLGGGVSGRAGTFAVATGGPELGIGVVTSGTPGTWTSLPPLTSAASPKVDNFTDVLFTLNGVFASVRSDALFGIIAMTITGGTPPTITVITPAPIDLEAPTAASMDDVLQRMVVGPGNYPMNLGFDTLTLLVTGDQEVRIFDVSNPALNSPPTIVQQLPVDTITVDGSGGFFAIGQGTQIMVYTSLGGSPTRTTQFSFSGFGMTIRGVRLTSSRFGRFVLCCAGERGLRVVQWSDTP